MHDSESCIAFLKELEEVDPRALNEQWQSVLRKLQAALFNSVTMEPRLVGEYARDAERRGKFPPIAELAEAGALEEAVALLSQRFAQ